MLLLSPAQTSVFLVLYNLIHEHPYDPSFKLSELTKQVQSDLRSRGEPCRLNERKVGDILTSLSFTNRTRTNTGYHLWIERCDQERIHESTILFGIRPDPIWNCDMCHPEDVREPRNPVPKVQMPEKVPSQDSTSEGSERRERPTDNGGPAGDGFSSGYSDHADSCTVSCTDATESRRHPIKREILPPTRGSNGLAQTG